MRLFYFLLTLLLLNLSASAQEGEKRELLKVERWAERLSKAYWNGEDRVFVIELSASDRDPILLTFADCQSKHFGATSLGDTSYLGWFQLEGEKQSALYARVNGKISRVGMEIITDPFVKIAALWDLPGDHQLERIEKSIWNIHLDQENFHMATGVSSNDKADRAPWLSAELLSTCTDVIEEDEHIHFIYPEGSMTVDRNGVLVRQVFPVGDRQRAMKLISVEPMKQWSVENYFGPIDHGQIEKQSLDPAQHIQLIKKLTTQIVQALARRDTKIAALEEKRALLEEHMIELQTPIIQTYVKQNDGTMFKTKQIFRELLNRLLPKHHQLIQEKHPQNKNMTYPAFLELVSKNIPPMADPIAEEHGKTFPAPPAPFLFTKKEQRGFEEKEKHLLKWFNDTSNSVYKKTFFREIVRLILIEEIKKAEQQGLE